LVTIDEVEKMISRKKGVSPVKCVRDKIIEKGRTIADSA